MISNFIIDLSDLKNHEENFNEFIKIAETVGAKSSYESDYDYNDSWKSIYFYKNKDNNFYKFLMFDTIYTKEELVNSTGASSDRIEFYTFNEFIKFFEQNRGFFTMSNLNLI